MKNDSQLLRIIIQKGKVKLLVFLLHYCAKTVSNPACALYLTVIFIKYTMIFFDRFCTFSHAFATYYDVDEKTVDF